LRTDHIEIEGTLLGVWQALNSRVLDFKETNRRLVKYKTLFG